MDSNELGALLTLDALLQEASVTKAAERLGLSTPAVSHALSKLRDRFDDKLLVRSGRAMALTPRAEALRDRVHEVITRAESVFAPEEPFSPRALEADYTLIATDHAMAVVGEVFEALVSAEAPGVVLQFRLGNMEATSALRSGEADLVTGTLAGLGSDLESEVLFEDELVCVARANHESIGESLTMAQFLAATHVEVERGSPGETHLDAKNDTLRGRRRVVRVFPSYHSALALVARSSHLLTIPKRLAMEMAPRLGLKLITPPAELSLTPDTIAMAWHPKYTHDPAHTWLRQQLSRSVSENVSAILEGAAAEAAPDITLEVEVVQVSELGSEESESVLVVEEVIEEASSPPSPPSPPASEPEKKKKKKKSKKKKKKKKKKAAE